MGITQENINWFKVKKVLDQPERGTQRKEHFLRKPKGHTPAVPKRAVFFDSESIVEAKTYNHIPYIICASFVNYETGTQRRFRYGSELAQKQDRTLKPLNAFWDDIVSFTKIKDVTWIFAHNCGYDLLATGGAKRMFERGFVPLGHPYEKGMVFIWEVALPNPEPRHCGEWFTKQTKDGLKVSFICSEESRCGKCRRKRKNIRNVRFVSTSNYYVQSLKNLGETFGLDKTNQDDDTKFEFDKLHEYPVADVLKYCDRDVDIIQKAMEALFDACNRGEETGFGSFKNTLPSMSFNAFQTWHMPDNTLFAHTNNDVLKLERESYYGGRVEVWKRGEAREPIFGLDINSMYPYVMKTYKYPTKLIRHSTTDTVADLQAYIDQDLAVIARVTVSVDENPFPLRYKGKLLFPAGTFRTVLSTPEIAYGLKHGLIKATQEVAVYKTEPIFKTFITQFYGKREQMKKSGDHVYDLLYKLVLNSLYGKFGQLKREWIEVGECDKDLVETEEILDYGSSKRMRFRKFGGKIYLEEHVEDVAYNAVISVASHVTAYARMLLWEYINTAGIKNHYYNDTDSLWVNQDGYEKLKAAGVINKTKLGFLDLEKTPERVAFYGPKHYEIEGKRTLKGISANAKQVADNVFQMLQWPSFKSAMNSGNLENFANREIEKTLSDEYGKGWVTRSGEVKPLVFALRDNEQVMLPWTQTQYVQHYKPDIIANMTKLKETAKKYL